MSKSRHLHMIFKTIITLQRKPKRKTDSHRKIRGLGKENCQNIQNTYARFHAELYKM